MVGRVHFGLPSIVVFLEMLRLRNNLLRKYEYKLFDKNSVFTENSKLITTRGEESRSAFFFFYFRHGFLTSVMKRKKEPAYYLALLRLVSKSDWSFKKAMFISQESSR